jgi:hypothetical protein
MSDCIGENSTSGSGHRNRAHANKLGYLFGGERFWLRRVRLEPTTLVNRRQANALHSRRGMGKNSPRMLGEQLTVAACLLNAVLW